MLLGAATSAQTATPLQAPLTASALAASTRAASTSADPTPRLVVAIDDNYPPYIMRDSSGALSGYLVDIWALWEQKTGVAVELLASDWSSAQQHMQSHRARVIDTMFQTPARAQLYDFSPSYAQIPTAIYTHQLIGGITELAELKGFVVGVKAGDACTDSLQQAGATNLRPYPSYDALVQAAISDEVRILCLDEPAAHYLLYKANADSLFNRAFTLQINELRRAVHKGDTQTRALLNRGFAAISTTEEQALHDKWMGSKLNLSGYARYLTYVLPGAVLIAMLLLLWGAVLRRQVKQRTAELDAEHTRLRILLAAMPDMVWMKDPAGIYRFCNPAFEKFYHIPEADLIGKTDYDLAASEHANLYRRHDREAILAGQPTYNEIWYEFAAEGRRLLFFTTKIPIRDKQGVLQGVLGIAQDITARKQAESALQTAAAAFESQQGMLITDANNRILRVNQSFIELSGYSTEELIGKPPSLLSSGRHDSAFYTAMWQSINNEGGWEGEVWNKRKSGESFPTWLSITAVKDLDGAVTHYVATHTDITERKAAEAQIVNLAFYDPLTSLPNRRLLADRLQLALASSLRSGCEGALLFIDLDHFKTLNDTLGHDKGDLLLQQVALRISDCVREQDTVARLGGDEFVVMLEGLHKISTEAASQIQMIAEKILAAINRPYDLKGVEYLCSSSIGITLFAAEKSSSAELMKRADLAMYKAKAAGRNTLCFFDPTMQAEVTDRAALLVELRSALALQQLELYYQPQLDGNERITGAEALIRWQHPQRGLISPASFIPLAEESGLILTLGTWVLETACRQLSQWAADPATSELTLAVNISATQLHQPHFIEQLMKILERSGANPCRLKLELTESLLLDNIEDCIDKMERLQIQGVRFALDDFGTGYSSLSYLKRLPLEQLKIDQSFIRDVLTDANDAAIARTIITLAHSLGLSVIAEGVETAAQRAFLASNTCHAYQGYLFSQPVPISAFNSLLLNDRSRHEGKKRAL